MHQQPADLEPRRRADDPAQPGHLRRRGRLGRPDRRCAAIASRRSPSTPTRAPACRASCSTACARRSKQIELPPGYSLEWGGEYEDSRDARAALARPLPYVLALMVFIVVCLFNSIRTTLLIWLIMPLAIIGVTAGLLLTGHAVRLHGPARACWPRRRADQELRSSS